MIKYRHIGIKKDINLRMVFCGVPLMFLIFLCVVFWGFYFVDDYHEELLVKYGVEVEAEIIRYDVIVEDNGYSYQLRYWYTAPNGTIYDGHTRKYFDESAAEKHVGDKIIITIVPSSISPDEQISVPKRYADLSGPKYSLHLTLAICCTVPIPILIYLLCYRGFYRNELDKKIIIGFEKGNLPERRGEVVKVSGWLIKYVKVRYEDEGKTCERWARSWFTIREAKYLEQKKIIRIVPYKNTYGILEEMAVETKQKKAKTQ
ncbi:MAG: hypothetical protein K2O67_03820 [Clostridia bacterium]|nr:hypothetical protein [Clostridia bacterium]